MPALTPMIIFVSCDVIATKFTRSWSLLERTQEYDREYVTGVPDGQMV